MPLDQGIIAHLRLPRHGVLAGHAHALALGVETEAVIAALDLLAGDASERQRREAMRATVGQRHSFAGRRAEQHDRFTLHGARQRGLGDRP